MKYICIICGEYVDQKEVDKDDIIDNEYVSGCSSSDCYRYFVGTNTSKCGVDTAFNKIEEQEREKQIKEFKRNRLLKKLERI